MQCRYHILVKCTICRIRIVCENNSIPFCFNLRYCFTVLNLSLIKSRTHRQRDLTIDLKPRDKPRSDKAGVQVGRYRGGVASRDSDCRLKWKGCMRIKCLIKLFVQFCYVNLGTECSVKYLDFTKDNLFEPTQKYLLSH